MSHLKLYIAVLDEVPDHMVPVLVAHAMLGANFEFYDSSTEYKDWLKNSFKKVVLKVNRREFDHICKEPDVYLAHENTTLNGEKSCVVLCPRTEWSRTIQFAKMWKPDANVALVTYQAARIEKLEKQVSDYMWEKSPGQGAY